MDFGLDRRHFKAVLFQEKLVIIGGYKGNQLTDMVTLFYECIVNFENLKISWYYYNMFTGRKLKSTNGRKNYDGFIE